MISAPLCSKTITFDGLGVQIGAHLAARIGSIGDQDSKSGGLGGQEATAEVVLAVRVMDRVAAGRTGPQRIPGASPKVM